MRYSDNYRILDRLFSRIIVSRKDRKDIHHKDEYEDQHDSRYTHQEASCSRISLTKHKVIVDQEQDYRK